MAQYVTLADKNFSKGINQLSAESQIGPGYVEDCLNADAEPEGYVAKRKGFETHQSLPVRITRMTQTPGAPGQVTFYLDSSIDVSSSVDISRLRSSPIFVYGRTQLAGSFDFTTSATGRYYTVFTNDVRLSFGIGPNEQAVYTADAHGFDTEALLVGTSLSTSENNRDNEQFLPSFINIDTTTYDVTITADNVGPAVLQTYAYVLDNSNQSGLAYTAGSLVPTPSGFGYDVLTIPAATHQLVNTDILVQLYDESTPGTIQQILADQVTNTTGNIEIRFAPSFSGTSVRVCLRAVASAKSREGTALAGQSTSVLLNNLDTPFLIAQAFLETSPGVWELVLPNSLVVDSDNAEATVSFQNVSLSDARFRVLWAEAEVRTNQLSVEEQVNSASPGDTNLSATPDIELTMWGLDHGEIYARPREGKPGWVTAVDSYRSEGEKYLCATLGWNLFREAFRASEGATYGLVRRWPRLRQRATATRILAPLFHGVGDTIERTRGGYTILGGESGWANVSSVAYTGTPNMVSVVVSTPNRSLTLNSSATEADLFLPEEANTTADLLSLRFSVWSQFDGNWPVVSVDFTDPGSITFVVRIPGIDSDDFDFAGQGNAGVFTDLMALDLGDNIKGYLPAVGDTVRSSSFETGESFEVLGVRNQDTGSNVLVGLLSGTVNLPNGQLVTFSHQGQVLSLRDDDPLSSDTYENIVRGDVLTITGQDSRRTVNSLFIEANATGTLVVDDEGNSAQFTLASTTTAALRAGQTILVSKAGRLSGEWLILSIDSLVAFTAIPSAPKPEYAGFAGVAFELVQGQLQLSLPGTFEDFEDSSVTVSTESRLVPAEYPTSSESIPPAAAYNTEHFAAAPFGDQPLVRTTMANDSMFATNYVDPIQKWDGQNIQRAGLPRWAPSVFVQKTTGGGGTIYVQPGKTVNGTVSANIFTVSPHTDAANISAEQELVGSDGEIYTVTAVNYTSGAVTLATTPSTPITSLTLFGLATYRYYIKASAVDANGYTLTTATYGAEDLRVQLTQSSAVLLRISGMPQWKGLPYDRIRIELYRTKATGAAPFFKIDEIDMPFGYGHSFSVSTLQDRGDYIDFRDATSDEALVLQDRLSSLLSPSGAVGDTYANIDCPPPAKFVTTIGNQAAYANVRSWPRIDLAVVRNNAVTTPVLAESWVLRKDSSDTGTMTSPNVRFGYRFCLSTAAGGGTVDTLSGTDIVTGTNYFDVVLAAGIGVPAIGGWIYLFRNSAAAGNAPRSIFNGWWPVADHPAANTVRVYCPGMTNAVVYSDAVDPNRALITTTASAQTDTLRHVPVYLGTDDFNFATANGNTEDFVSRTLYRLASAINASMRQGYGTFGLTTLEPGPFSPWATAVAGNQLGGNSLLLEFPLALPTTPELQLGNTPAATPAGFQVFGNDTPRGPTASIGARTLIRSSRVLLAPSGYPEIVDNPFSDNPRNTLSVVDVNPADGQDITGIVPFFGESAFGGAVTSGQLVVFKTDSVYFLDPATRAITKVESQGVGCSAPGSIASTRQGVIFAHTSGLYRLTRATTVEPIGANLDRLWQLRVDKSPASFEVMQAHNYTSTRRYRFFWPSQEDAGTAGQTPRNSNVFSYDYTAEQKGEFGGWSRYDNHNLTNACNLAGEAYAGTWTGRLVRFLQEEKPESYRDEGAPVNMQVTFKATDFGDDAVRKKLLHVMVGFRLPVSSDGSGTTLRSVQVQQASELKENFTTLDAATILAASPRDGLSSEVAVRQQTLRYSPEFTKAVYHQIRISDATLSAPVQVVSLGYRVSGLSTKGTQQAADTAS